jgi:uncharacterized protein
MGEGLPFMFQRFDVMPQAVTKLARPISDYLRENVHYTFNGFNLAPTFLNLLLELGGVERIMFSADYPYQSMAQARAFLEQLPVSAADKERIAHGNAEHLSGCNNAASTAPKVTCLVHMTRGPGQLLRSISAMPARRP